MAVTDGTRSEPLAGAALRGARALGGAKAVTELMRLSTMVLVAHLVTPREFGYVAVAMVINSVAQGLAMEFVATPLVQRKTVERHEIRTAVTLAIVIGLAVTGALGLVVALVGPLLFAPRAVHLMLLLVPMLTIAAAGSVSLALIQRRLAFGVLSRIDVITGAVTGATTVVAALAGAQGAAVILGALGGAVATTVCAFVASPLPPPGWSTRDAVDQVRFGVPATLAAMLNTLFRNVDYMILGVVMPAAAVGLYWRAYQLGVEYQSKATSVVVRVAFPVYSRAVDVADMRAMRSRLGRAQETLITPFLALLIALAPALIPWVYGHNWTGAVGPTQALALAGILVTMRTTAGPFAIALGHPRLLAAFESSSVLIFGGAVYLASGSGLMAVCWAGVGAHATLLALSWYLLMRRPGGVQLRDLLEDSKAALSGAAVVILVSGATRIGLAQWGVPAPLIVVAGGAIGFAAYGLWLRLLFPRAWADLDRVRGGLRPWRRFRRSSEVAVAAPGAPVMEEALT